MSTNALETGVKPGEKGLKQNAIGFLSSCVIGVASTAPGYSLAATLGFIAVAVGVFSPAIMLVAFVPMLLIATSYYYMNRADPDCGTTFSWVTRGLGPHLGWLGGWAIVVADVIVMANLAQIAGLYTFLLFGAKGAAASTLWVTVLGVIWIVIMTAIVTIGIALSARTQWFLLAAEYSILVVFGIVALVKVYTSHPIGSIHVSWSWFAPWDISSFNAVTAGVLLAVFIYWGWDSGVTVNEETQNSRRAPGLGAIVSTLFLVFIYVLVATAATAYAGPKALGDHSDDALSFLGHGVFGSGWDKLLILAVLTSAAASTQTTILPTARTTLSMARHGAAPRALGRVHPRFLTPHISSILMGLFSIVWYVGLTVFSENVLFDSIAALGLMISFYLGLTGIACVFYFRHQIVKSVKNFLLIGVAPFAGAAILGYVFVKSCINLADPANSESGTSWFGVGPPLLIAVIFLALGIVLMVVTQFTHPTFFRRRPETAPDDVLLDPEGAPVGN
ncbi:MAG: APC family permease [Actinobacteria bacterium]|nr:APC family permease [Actinomycetota bacterium]